MGEIEVLHVYMLADLFKAGHSCCCCWFDTC